MCLSIVPDMWFPILFWPLLLIHAAVALYNYQRDSELLFLRVYFCCVVRFFFSTLGEKCKKPPAWLRRATGCLRSARPQLCILVMNSDTTARGNSEHGRHEPKLTRRCQQCVWSGRSGNHLHSQNVCGESQPRVGVDAIPYDIGRRVS